MPEEPSVPSLAQYSFNSTNELTAVGANSYSYDNNGNMLSKTTAAGASTYTWDYENRMISATVPAQNGGAATTATFQYDPLGRRIQKTTPSGAKIYLYDGANVVAELNSSGAVTSSYVQGPGVDQPLAVSIGGVPYYYEQDALGSVTSLTGAAGQIAASYTYDAFGRSTETGSLRQPYRFTGREWDYETGLYYYRARYYDPTIGRFLSEDPVGVAGGSNFYRYVGNNPILLSDPFGLCPKCSSLSFDNPRDFWNDAFATPDQVEKYLESTNAPSSWDGAEAAEAFTAKGINPLLAIAIMGAETSLGGSPNGLTSRNTRDPFSSGGANFADSLTRGLNLVVKLENATRSDSTPLTALEGNNNTLTWGKAYDTGGPKERADWLSHVESWFRKAAKGMGLCN